MGAKSRTEGTAFFPNLGPPKKHTRKIDADIPYKSSVTTKPNKVGISFDNAYADALLGDPNEIFSFKLGLGWCLVPNRGFGCRVSRAA